MSDWTDILKTVAPVIGGALGGPFGAAATQFLANALTGDETKPLKDLAPMIAGASPEQLAKLKQIDSDFEQHMADLGFKREQMTVQDRQDARAFAIKTTIIPQAILTVLVLFAFFSILIGFLASWLHLPMDEATRQIITILITLVVRETTAVFQFWLGSSTGSKDKDNQITKLLDQ